MPPQPTVQPNQQQGGTALDPKIVNLAKAIRQVESGGNFTQAGKSGEYGAYQFLPTTWASSSAKYLGKAVPLNQATPEQQNEVAYKQLSDWATEHPEWNVGNFASAWNAGPGKPNAYQENYKGVNAQGVAYDTPAYAKQVAEAYQTFKAQGGGGQVAQPAAPKKDFLDTASDLVNDVFPAKNVGNLIGTGIAKLLHPSVAGNIHTDATLGGVAGDVGQNALTLLSLGAGGLLGAGEAAGAKALTAAGLGSKALEAGKVAEIANPLTKTTQLVSPLAKRATQAATGLGLGYGFDVANKLSNHNPNPLTPGLGTALGVAAPLAGPALRGAGNLAAHLSGAATGVGADVLKTGLEAATAGGADRAAFKTALRGKTSPESLVTDARSALKTLSQNRSEAYNNSIDKIEKDTFITKAGKTYVKKFDPELKKALFVPTNLSTKGVKDVATRTLKSIGLDAKGKVIDFSKRPSLDAKGIQTIHNFVYNWDDLTPKGLNQLRQEVAGFRKGGLNPSPADNRFNTYVDNLTRNITNYLGERVPQIGEMNANYAKASTMINEIKRGLSLGKGAQTDTAFRKLNSVLRTNNEFRKQLLSQLEDEAGKQLPAKIAGQQLSEILPRGLVRSIEGAGAVGGLLSGIGILPVLKAALFTSPRLAGETLLALGFTRQKANIFARALGVSGMLFPVVGANAVKNADNSDNK